jgi:hypothetical protein
MGRPKRGIGDAVYALFPIVWFALDIIAAWHSVGWAIWNGFEPLSPMLIIGTAVASFVAGIWFAMVGV